MGAQGAVSGLGFDLPAPCIGHVLGRGVGSCSNEGSIALTTVIMADDGGPMPVIVTACPEHVRGARLYVERLGIGDPVETWATRSLAEQWGTVVESGLDFHRLSA
jgi:hypothetical protein